MRHRWGGGERKGVPPLSVVWLKTGKTGRPSFIFSIAKKEEEVEIGKEAQNNMVKEKGDRKKERGPNPSARKG